jgi:hypothetical protein
VIVPAFENLTEEQKLVKDVKTLTKFDATIIKNKNKYLWRPLSEAFKCVGLKLNKKEVTRKVQGLSAEPKVRLAISFSATRKYPYWPGMHIVHPVSGITVKHFQFEDHMDNIHSGAIEEARHLIRKEMVALPELDDLCIRINRKEFDRLKSNAGALKDLINGDVKRLKRAQKWLADVAKVIKEQGEISYIIEKYRKPVQLKYNRLYSGGNSIQACVRELRAILARKYYDDWDIVNAHPVIVCALVGHQNAPKLEEYIDYRDKILKGVKAYYGCDRSAAKELFIRMLNGGSHGTTEAWGWLQDKNIGISQSKRNKVLDQGHMPFVTAFREEMLRLNKPVIEAVDRHLKRIGARTVSDEFKRKSADPVWMRSHKHPEWTKFSWAVCYYEAWILDIMKKFINYSSSHDSPPLTKIGSYIFDGMLVRKEVQFNKKACEDKIFKETQIRVKLAKKML